MKRGWFVQEALLSRNEIFQLHHEEDGGRLHGIFDLEAGGSSTAGEAMLANK